MSQPQYAIMRFAKYKGPEITNIEAHNERRKDSLAAPLIDTKIYAAGLFHLLAQSIDRPQTY